MSEGSGFGNLLSEAASRFTTPGAVPLEIVEPASFSPDETMVVPAMRELATEGMGVVEAPAEAEVAVGTEPAAVDETGNLVPEMVESTEPEPVAVEPLDEEAAEAAVADEGEPVVSEGAADGTADGATADSDEDAAAEGDAAVSTEDVPAEEDAAAPAEDVPAEDVAPAAAADDEVHDIYSASPDATLAGRVAADAWLAEGSSYGDDPIEEPTIEGEALDVLDASTAYGYNAVEADDEPVVDEPAALPVVEAPRADFDWEPPTFRMVDAEYEVLDDEESGDDVYVPRGFDTAGYEAEEEVAYGDEAASDEASEPVATELPAEVEDEASYEEYEGSEELAADVPYGTDEVAESYDDDYGYEEEAVEQPRAGLFGLRRRAAVADRVPVEVVDVPEFDYVPDDLGAAAGVAPAPQEVPEPEPVQSVWGESDLTNDAAAEVDVAPAAWVVPEPVAADEAEVAEAAEAVVEAAAEVEPEPEPMAEVEPAVVAAEDEPEPEPALAAEPAEPVRLWTPPTIDEPVATEAPAAERDAIDEPVVVEPIAAEPEPASVAQVDSDATAILHDLFASAPSPSRMMEPEPVPEPEPLPDISATAILHDMFSAMPTIELEPEPVVEAEPLVEAAVDAAVVESEPVVSEPVEQVEADREPELAPAEPEDLADDSEPESVEPEELAVEQDLDAAPVAEVPEPVEELEPEQVEPEAASESEPEPELALAPEDAPAPEADEPEAEAAFVSAAVTASEVEPVPLEAEPLDEAPLEAEAEMADVPAVEAPKNIIDADLFEEDEAETEAAVAEPAAPAVEPVPAGAVEAEPATSPVASDPEPEPEPEPVAPEAVEDSAPEPAPEAALSPESTLAPGITFSTEDDALNDDLTERDDSGLITMSARAEDEVAAAMPVRRERIPKPRAVDDPEWGKSTYKPQVVSAGRRAMLLDLPDPSVISVDPLRGSDADSSGATAPIDMAQMRRFEVLRNVPSPLDEPGNTGNVASAQTKPAREKPEAPAASDLAEPADGGPAPRPYNGKGGKNIGARSPKKNAKRRGMRFGHGRRGKEEDQQVESMGEWLGLGDDFDAKKDGRQIGTWDNFADRDDDSSKGTWKGGATLRSGLRRNRYDDEDYDEYDPAEGGPMLGVPNFDSLDLRAIPEIDGSIDVDDPDELNGPLDDVIIEPTEGEELDPETMAELREAVLRLGDDDLIAHDIWFVGLGASSLDHAGMRAFLDEHRRDIRGAFLVNLDSVGSGKLSLLTREGMGRKTRADRRMGRMLTNIAEALHINLERADYGWDETDATPALQRSVRVATLMGMSDDGVPALSHTQNDEPEYLDDAQIANVADLIAELIRRS